MVVEMIRVAGDAGVRGQMLGSMRREQVSACLLDWMAGLRSVGIADPQAYLAGFLQNSDFLSAIEAHTPDLLEEVRGIALGSSLPFELVLASQLMDEEWAYRPSAHTRGEAIQKCSSVAFAAGDGPTWIGQNMDLPAHTDGHQVLLHIVPQAQDPGALVFSIGGMIGLLGVNTRGVAVCVNSIPQLSASQSGLPVAFVIRRLLQSLTLGETIELARTLPHATAQHYLIADSHEVRSFEASPAGVVEYRPSDSSRILHTNHPLAAHEGLAAPAGEQANSLARLRSLTRRLASGQPDLRAIQEALCSCDDAAHPVCRRRTPGASVTALTGMANFTTGSMISALRFDSAVVDSWVTAGPPSLDEYVHVRLPKDAVA